MHSSGLRLWTWTWRCQWQNKTNSPSLYLFCLFFHQPTHTYIKEKEKKSSLRCNKNFHPFGDKEAAGFSSRARVMYARLRTTCVGDEQLVPITRFSQYKTESGDIISKVAFMSSWLLKTKKRETIEQRQGKNIKVHIFFQFHILFL